MTKPLAEIGIRAGREDDAHFILGTWLNSYRKNSQFAKPILRTYYFRFHQAVVLDILHRSTAIIAVAHDPSDDTVIYGYLVGERGVTDRDVVHYIFVKEPWQNLGIATRLLAGAGIDPTRLYFTHWTRDRADMNPKSPHCGTMRWRGADTLLTKWPLAREVPDPNDRSHKKLLYIEGNIYIPYLISRNQQ